jgi:hypothetical protein
MFGVSVGIGIYGNGFHAQALGGGGHTASDLASICDEYLVEHF